MLDKPRILSLYSPTLKKWGLFILDLSCLSFRPSVHLSPIISFPLNILRTLLYNLSKFCMCIDIDMILLGIVTCHSPQICTRVMALDLLQNFVSAQYFENKLTEFHQILYMHAY